MNKCKQYDRPLNEIDTKKNKCIVKGMLIWKKPLRSRKFFKYHPSW